MLSFNARTNFLERDNVTLALKMLSFPRRSRPQMHARIKLLPINLRDIVAALLLF